jgi:hypothetical protein
MYICISLIIQLQMFFKRRIYSSVQISVKLHVSHQRKKIFIKLKVKTGSVPCRMIRIREAIIYVSDFIHLPDIQWIEL